MILGSSKERGRPPRKGVCADCIHAAGMLGERCTNERQVQRLRRVATTGAVPANDSRRAGQPCGPSADLWEPA